ncbi:hypothetical protein [Nostoc sp. CMAA1605]|nr:hypothetical protein [Nostoc sp. CMAA1605]
MGIGDWELGIGNWGLGFLLITHYSSLTTKHKPPRLNLWGWQV